MGSVNTEVIHVTTTTTHNTPPSGITPATSASTRIDWFEGPPDDGESGRDDMPRSSSSPINTPYLMVTRITADPTAAQLESAVPADRRKSLPARVRRGFWQWRTRLGRMDPVKLAYLRTSFVFAISVFVTWTPSSINRVHDVLRGAEVGGHSRSPPSFGLNLASAVVLPLQGVWNAVIFFSTSSIALREEFRARADAFRGLPRGHQAANAARRERERERTLELERRCGGGLNNKKNHAARRSISDLSGGSSQRRVDSSGDDSGGSGNGNGNGSIKGSTASKARQDSVISSELSDSVVGSPMLGNANNNTATGSTMRVIKGGSLSSL